MELIYTNDLCTGCNKCVRGCPVLTANIATQEGYVTVDPDKCIACGECFDVCPLKHSGIGNHSGIQTFRDFFCDLLRI